MTLSRRDEFAARALQGLLAEPMYGDEGSNFDPTGYASSAIEYADALIAELERTAPKPERAEIEDDGREIFDELNSIVSVSRSGRHSGRIRLDIYNAHLALSDARLYAKRIMKLCDEIEEKK